jgi:hypothetical protein
MIRVRSILLFLTVSIMTPFASHAQEWSGILAPNRAIDWSGAGVAGGIPANRTQCGSTIAPYTGAPTIINNALAACGANRYVQLGAGTFNLSSGIKIQARNVTLRGAGADQTSLVFTSTDSCQGLYADICVESYDTNWGGGPSNGPVSWIAGYSKGTTVITLASVPNLKVGNPIILDQLDDSSDTGSVYVCSASGSNCSLQGGGGGQRTGRYQFQIAMVTGCNGSTTPGFSCSGTNVAVTIDRGLDMPNWRSSQSPQAWWATNPVSGVGIEDLSVDNTASEVAVGEGISFFNATNSWVRGVRDIKSHRAHVGVEYSAHITVRDSYFFLTQNSIDQSYGIDCFASSDNLIENNIYQAVSGPLTMNGCTGTVFGYNYAINGYYTGSAGWIQAMTNPHTGGVAMILYEGNVGSRIDSDNFHGSHNFITAFRNYWSGYSPACWQSGGTYATATFGTCTNPFMAANLLSYSRFYNFVGNVLGQSGIQTGSVYSIGGGNSVNGVTVANDPNVGLTLMRWGNYDTVTATSRFVASEVPTSLTGAQAPFSNPVPANNSLPSTFYLPGKPAWWPSAKAWPVIGPDVSGGNGPIARGLVYTIPAQDCFLNTMHGPSNGTGGPYTFNANTCYGKLRRPI